MTLRRPAALLSVLATLMSSPLLAQLDDEQPVIIGPMAGVVISTFRGAGVGDADVRTGLVAGAFATITLTPYFAIEPQAFYIQKGANYHADSSGVALNSEYALSYIELPLLFKARYPIGEGPWPLIVGAIAGPAIGINVGCDYIDNDGRSTKCGQIDLGPTTTSSEAAGVDFSAVFGVTLDYYHFAFQARYDYGFTNVFTEAPLAFYTPRDIKNQAWEITLGYKVAIH